MTTPSTTAPDLDLPRVRRAVHDTLDAFLAAKADGPDGRHLGAPLQVLRGFLDGGGKRVRPLYCCLGYFAVQGRPLDPTVLRAAAGLELFHTFALLHDDVIDESETRHGRPTVPRAFAAQRPGSRAAWFGASAAILLGDLCEAWSAELLGGPGFPDSARQVVDRMRSELSIGQYLDLCAFGSDFGTVDEAMTVIHYKTTKYTVERPLQIGAALAGAGQDVLDACAAYAQPLGEAFQMYNDLEDVASDDRCESVGGDLREGKHTVVLALAGQRADASQARRLAALVGDPALDSAGLAEARSLIAVTGAPAIVRSMIVDRRRKALEILEAAPLHSAAKTALARLTDLAVPGVADWSTDPPQQPGQTLRVAAQRSVCS
ncbi:hypothetical protein AR457_40005 [Streptomyces agglomeratus]|uniref:polyprenyl synthetase family protein n=1 Tax=Streptomyces agglomeratus TaxID=285458 RepID=UPI00085283D8|nr:polyprenyl synthetase family protein [Streptomyces agglomeratus]OEJ22078.1 hypothetical protein AR457_40005 [Streptomyces agglomeratus]OEJ36915.1 hypothetical protein BGK70_00660 [Streptomyces agglomeratus]